MPPDAILSGLILLMSYFMSHCVVTVPGTTWIEPVIIWICIVMPTGSGKTPLFSYLSSLVQQAREKLKISRIDPAWLLDEASFEKMGELMAANHSKLLGMYDELSTFLAQINIYRGKGLADSHDLATFLSLYNGKSWTRATGKSRSISYVPYPRERGPTTECRPTPHFGLNFLLRSSVYSNMRPCVAALESAAQIHEMVGLYFE